MEISELCLKQGQGLNARAVPPEYLLGLCDAGAVSCALPVELSGQLGAVCYVRSWETRR